MIEKLECQWCGSDDGTHECECGQVLTAKQCDEQCGFCESCGRNLK